MCVMAGRGVARDSPLQVTNCSDVTRKSLLRGREMSVPFRLSSGVCKGRHSCGSSSFRVRCKVLWWYFAGSRFKQMFQCVTGCRGVTVVLRYWCWVDILVVLGLSKCFGLTLVLLEEK